MTSGSRLSVLVCEGRDDLAAIRGLLKELGATKRSEEARRPSRSGASAPEHWSLARSTLIVQSVGAKESLPQATLDFAQGTAAERPSQILICFDPDDDQASKEFEFLLGPVRDAGRSSPPERVGDDWRIRVRDRDVLLIPASWRSQGDSSFDHLPDHHSLERVLISALMNSSVPDELKRWTEKTTSELAKLVDGHGWKRAFRLWAAAVDPRAEGFVDRLLQNDGTRLACLGALRGTPVNAALRLALENV